MRRKSERNKAKASPEKKAEKPTRKSTRKRGKRSPSTTPERDNSNDTATPSNRDSESETTGKTATITSQIRSQARDCEAISELAESNVTSTETTIKQQDEEDAGSVWKVARADASPGEIQKLKLCRQRNMSETSDASSSRKRSNRWHEGSEGITEEIDSADERNTTVVSSKTASVVSAKRTDEIISDLPGRNSSEEVSDSKEFPPEIAKAELSDVKPNIDHDERHDETNETEIAINTIEHDDDGHKERVIIGDEPSGDLARSAVIGTNGEPNEAEISKAEETKSPTPSVDKIDATCEDENKIKVSSVIEKEENEDLRESKDSSSDDNENKTDVVKRETVKETETMTITTKSVSRECSDSSEDNSDNEREGKNSRKSLPRTTSRRKHRDKYRDSSNSDTAESEEEPVRGKERDERKEMKKIREKEEIEVEANEKDVSHTPETRSETPISHQVPVVSETKIVENDKKHPKSNDESERTDQTVIQSAMTSAQSQTNYKPAKVNLKRSFSVRPSVETVELTKEATVNNANDLANQDKENHASSEQIDVKSIPKKRRWGTILASSDAAPAFSVSTDSLKVLVPGAKPLPINEVRLSKDDDEERDRRNQREKRYSTSESGPEYKSRDDGEKSKNPEAKKDAKGDNHIASRRKISIVKDTQNTKSPSSPAAIPTSILLIKNLVRPFTLNQIRELLTRTGTIVENGFWMDRIKSKCFVEYSNEDQAFETRQALHGISWPVSNPKRLQVEYASKEDMEMARELCKDQPISRKTEPLAANDGWQQDWARDERTNSTTKVTVVREWDLGKEDGQHFGKDKEREKKDLEKKRRQRSRSPTVEAHLPAPARKFKKKEDDPPPAKLLDDLFRKTKATPCIYWLPLTNEQIVVKEEMRRQHMAEHARRLEEMRRAERNRDGRRRRSPRK